MLVPPVSFPFLFVASTLASFTIFRIQSQVLFLKNGIDFL